MPWDERFDFNDFILSLNFETPPLFGHLESPFDGFRFKKLECWRTFAVPKFSLTIFFEKVILHEEASTVKPPYIIWVGFGVVVVHFHLIYYDSAPRYKI